MKILKTYKFRIYPTKANKCLFNKTFGCCRFIYNTMLYEITNKKQRPTEKQLKEKFPFLKEVDSIALQQSRINLQTGFKNFKNKKAKYPIFKSRKSRQSFRTVSTRGNIKIDFNNHTIKLPKMNPIKFRDPRTFTDPIRQVTVSLDKTGKYFVSILVETEIYVQPVEVFTEEKVIGGDMGIATFITLSDGTKVPNPKFYRKLENSLRKAQKQFSKTKKRSKRREKLRRKVAAVHAKIVNCRKDFLHKLSSLIIKNFDGICIENLNIKGMLKNRRLSKSIQDLGWAKFANMLEYKAIWAGKTVLKAGRFFPSSKQCSACPYIKKTLSLSERFWTCPNCGAYHDRDINAAINLKKLLLEILLSTQGIRVTGHGLSGQSYAGGDDVRLKLAFASNAVV